MWRRRPRRRTPQTTPCSPPPSPSQSAPKAEYAFQAASGKASPPQSDRNGRAQSWRTPDLFRSPLRKCRGGMMNQASARGNQYLVLFSTYYNYTIFRAFFQCFSIFKCFKIDYILQITLIFCLNGKK